MAALRWLGQTDKRIGTALGRDPETVRYQLDPLAFQRHRQSSRMHYYRMRPERLASQALYQLEHKEERKASHAAQSRRSYWANRESIRARRADRRHNGNSSIST